MARRFQFRLQTLLKVRQLREQEAKRKVAAQRAEIARLDRLNELTAQAILQQQAALTETQRGTRLDPGELARGRAWIAHLRYTVVQRGLQRAQLLQQLAQLQRVWRAARTDARIIEKLRERRWQEYRRDRAHAEQAAADELAQQLQQLGFAAPVI